MEYLGKKTGNRSVKVAKIRVNNSEANYRHRLLKAIARRIHQAQPINEIVNSIVTEIKQILAVDSAAIWQISDIGGSQIIASSGSIACHCKQIGSNWHLADIDVSQQCLCITPNIERQNAENYPLEIHAVVAAQLILPIIQNSNTWGLLIIAQSTCRQWKRAEINFLNEIAIQIAIALHQDNLQSQLNVAQKERLAIIKDITEREQLASTLR